MAPKKSAEKAAGPRSGKLERKATRALRDLQSAHADLDPDLPQLVGVSGGRDSVALLHFLHRAGYTRLVVCHVHHGIRGAEADGDAAFVRELATGMGLPYEELAVDVSALAKAAKASLETTAREVRRRFFLESAQRHGTPNVFLAHHADDDVETILHHLLRGSGLRGLQGMQTWRETESGLRLVRPLLQVSRPEIDAYRIAHALPYREDATNQSLEPTRNRLRHQVVPFLRETLGREVTATVQRFSSLAAEDNDLLERLTEQLTTEHQLLHEDGSLLLKSALKEAHPALQRRVLRHWLREIHHTPDVGGALVESALPLLDGGRISKINLPGEGRLRRKAGRLFIEKE